MSELLIVKKILEFLIFHAFIDDESSLIKPSQNGILDRQQPTSTNFLDIRSNSQKVLDSLSMVTFGSPHECSFPIFSHNIGIGFILLDKELAYLCTAIDCGSMKRSSFVVDSERFINNLRFAV